MITWSETRQRLNQDKQRLIDSYAADNSKKPVFMILNTSYQCVFLYRLSHYLYLRNRTSLARLFWYLNLLLNGAEISPTSDIQAGILFNKPLGLIITGNIGKNCTIESNTAIIPDAFSLESDVRSILPVLGDNVRVGIAVTISGAIKIGNDVIIGPRCLVDCDLEDSSQLWLDSLLIRSKPAN